MDDLINVVGNLVGNEILGTFVVFIILLAWSVWVANRISPFSWSNSTNVRTLRIFYEHEQLLIEALEYFRERSWAALAAEFELMRNGQSDGNDLGYLREQSRAWERLSGEVKLQINGSPFVSGEK